ncbi:phage tail protein [Spartinivicinus ruber]|uniref:phage tail protein n=1 Tax=Spartinivicinus ruber TaxID=2683272 RepID=UPI0013D4A4E5|nr:phage tail protein [Spartinivicinus ruber]
MSGFTLQIDLRESTGQLINNLAFTEDMINQAVRRALKRTGVWFRTHTKRAIGRELGIAQKALNRRYRVTVSRNKPTLSIWVGVLAIAAHKTGDPRQNAAGVQVQEQYDGAFAANMFGNGERVYIRTAVNAEQGHVTVAKTGQKLVNQNRVHRHRFPVEVVGMEISDSSLAILERYEKLVNKRYKRFLQHEINYIINYA